MHVLLLAHAAVTLSLVGLIWTIQLVHYPLFRYVDPDQFEAFHAQHARRITWLVAILMPAELALASLLVIKAPSIATVAGLLMVLAIWILTAFVQIPAHTRLSDGLDKDVVDALVRGNWLRTILWTLRAALALLLLL